MRFLSISVCLSRDSVSPVCGIFLKQVKVGIAQKGGGGQACQNRFSAFIGLVIMDFSFESLSRISESLGTLEQHKFLRNSVSPVCGIFLFGKS